MWISWTIGIRCYCGVVSTVTFIGDGIMCIGLVCRNIPELLNNTFVDIKVYEDKEVHFIREDGSRVIMYHQTDCSETVFLEEVIGDLDNLLNIPITMAEEVKQDLDDYADAEIMWTFYKLATVKGYVTLRWYGDSNGFYSVSVSIYDEKPWTLDIPYRMDLTPEEAKAIIGDYVAKNNILEMRCRDIDRVLSIKQGYPNNSIVIRVKDKKTFEYSLLSILLMDICDIEFYRMHCMIEVIDDTDKELIELYNRYDLVWKEGVWLV